MKNETLNVEVLENTFNVMNLENTLNVDDFENCATGEELEAAILNIQGVTDIQNTTLNGGIVNILLGDYEIPTKGAVSIS